MLLPILHGSLRKQPSLLTPRRRNVFFSSSSWTAGSNSEDTETEPEFLLYRQVAQNIAKGLKEEERLGDPSTSKTTLSVKYFIVVERSEANSPPSERDSKVVENAKAPPLRTEVSVKPKEPKSSSSVTEQSESVPSPQDSKDHQKVPENVAALIQELLKDGERQHVFYSLGFWWTVGFLRHPSNFVLTEKAIYILAYVLSRHPYQKADVPVKQGM